MKKKLREHEHYRAMVRKSFASERKAFLCPLLQMRSVKSFDLRKNAAPVGLARPYSVCHVGLSLLLPSCAKRGGASSEDR